MRSRPGGNVHYLPQMRASIVSRLQQTVADSLGGELPIVLAISGGVDSMVLLDAAAATVPARRLCVATFDHGTGSAATKAAALVRVRAAVFGLACVSERARTRLWSRAEAELRNARWRFLRSVASRRGALVATAHTQDDQVETVLMRVLRGAGARGLAGMYAPSDVARPLLAFTRRDVMRYARARSGLDRGPIQPVARLSAESREARAAARIANRATGDRPRPARRGACRGSVATRRHVLRRSGRGTAHRIRRGWRGCRRARAAGL